MPGLMKDDRNTSGDSKATDRTVAAEKSSALVHRLAAAPRTPKNSLARFIRENANDLRISRDEGVAWEDIMAAVRETFPEAEQTSVETYIARFAPAKATRKQRENEAAARLLARPSVSTTMAIAKEPIPVQQPASTGNPFLPRRPPPNDL